MWYETLAKPAWAPPSSLFGTVWSILYPIIIVAYGYVVVRALSGAIPRSVLWPIGLNIAANVAFTPIMFGMRNLELATVDIVVVLVTIVWSMVAIWPHAWPAALALVPYLIWVSIETVLQASILLLNR
jgi:tryptophan-rich sensory protein